MKACGFIQMVYKKSRNCRKEAGLNRIKIHYFFILGAAEGFPHSVFDTFCTAASFHNGAENLEKLKTCGF